MHLDKPMGDSSTQSILSRLPFLATPGESASHSRQGVEEEKREIGEKEREMIWHAYLVYWRDVSVQPIATSLISCSR